MSCSEFSVPRQRLPRWPPRRPPASPHRARTLPGVGNDYDKQLRQLIAIAEAQGWRVARTSSGHWRFAPPDSAASIVIAPGTTSAGRAAQNLRGDLRRAGLVL